MNGSAVIRNSLGSLLLGLFVMISFSQPIEAQTSVSMTAEVGDTGYILEGTAFPDALITFADEGVVIGTVQADSDGVFSKEFTSQPYGPQTITVTATDGLLAGTPVEVSFLSIRFSTITIENIHLPPVIALNGTTFSPGSLVILNGRAQPGSNIDVVVSGITGFTLNTVTNITGDFQVSFAAGTLPEGSYTITATTLLTSNASSTTATALPFAIDYPDPTATPTIVPSPFVSGVQPTGSATDTSATSGTSNQGLEEIGSQANEEERLSTTPESSCVYEYERLCFFDTEDIGELSFEEEFLPFLTGFMRIFGDRSKGNGNGQRSPFDFFGSQLTNRFGSQSAELSQSDSVFDINNDGLIDLMDFSIALFHASKPKSNVLGVVADQRNNTGSNPGTVPDGFGINQSGAFLTPNGLLLLILALILVIVSLVIAWVVDRYYRKPSSKRLQRYISWTLVMSFSIILVLLVSQRMVVGTMLQGASADVVLDEKKMYFSGAEFAYPLRVRSQRTPVNAIQLDLQFDPNAMKVKRVETTNGIANIILVNDFSNTDGWVRVVGGIPYPGFTGEDGVVATVFFDIVGAEGNTSIRIMPSSRLLAADGKGTDLFYSFRSARIEVTGE